MIASVATSAVGSSVAYPTVSNDPGKKAPVPGQTPSTIVTLSTGGPKDFATVAKDARATLDQGYARLGKQSSIFTTHDEWMSIVGGLDRRSLHAIASNEGGQFSKYERGAAQSLMGHQQAEAMGLIDGTNMMDPAGSYLRGIRFLDGVSEEEKTSLVWATSRAISQQAYEGLAKSAGRMVENVDIDHPLVKLIRSALDAQAALGDPSKSVYDMPQYQQAKQLAGEKKGLPANLVDRRA